MAPFECHGCGQTGDEEDLAESLIRCFLCPGCDAAILPPYLAFPAPPDDSERWRKVAVALTQLAVLGYAEVDVEDMANELFKLLSEAHPFMRSPVPMDAEDFELDWPAGDCTAHEGIDLDAIFSVVADSDGEDAAVFVHHSVGLSGPEATGIEEQITKEVEGFDLSLRAGTTWFRCSGYDGGEVQYGQGYGDTFTIEGYWMYEKITQEEALRVLPDVAARHIERLRAGLEESLPLPAEAEPGARPDGDGDPLDGVNHLTVANGSDVEIPVSQSTKGGT